MWGAGGGVVAPLLLAVVFLALTLTQLGFLREVGWSAIRRTDVEWPSLLELGPHGWIMQAALPSAACLGLAFAGSVLAEARGVSERVGGAALGLMSLAVAAMALPPDRPGTATQSWNESAHNAVYPVIPASALVAATAFVLGANANGWRRSRRHASIAFLALASASLSLTLAAAVAQLARFAFFGSLLSWACYLAATLLLDLRTTDKETKDIES